MREASQEAQPQVPMSARTNNSTLTDAPLTRNSLVVLQGDENDLLSESPVFAKAKNEEMPAS